MRYYLIDDIYENQLRAIEKALDDAGLKAPLDGLYYLPIPAAMLNDEQRDHAEHGPFIMALETSLYPESDQGWVKLELLVRARNILRCSCVSYASAELRTHMIDYVDSFIAQLGIDT